MYPKIVKEVINLYVSDSLKRVKQDNKIATFYTKRTAEDGQINWDWQKERIKNWVRALSFPYPGAFAFYENKKIIIDKISFSEKGYDNSISNGTILQIDPDLLIKTSNGTIKIEEIRNNNIEFNKNKILS